MSVMLETTRGVIVIDLFTDNCPNTCRNFLKLCKIKYYHHCLFFNVQKDFIIQTGDPTGTGKGGDSIYKALYGDQARFFDDEIKPTLRHKKAGTVSMANAGANLNASQFFITVRDELDSLDDKHTIFGEVAEGMDIAKDIADSFVDSAGRPLVNIRVLRAAVIDDPYPDPPGLADLIPPTSPERVVDPSDVRPEDGWVPNAESRPPDEVERDSRRKEAQQRAVVLEMVGDLPDADATVEEHMLFVCKLNAVTTEEDLEIIFSQFGTVVACDVIRDYKTGASLNYAFLGFDRKEAAEAAYLKMDNVLIDDRRIHVDFSQSMHHLWSRYKKGGKRGLSAEDAALAAGMGGEVTVTGTGMGVEMLYGRAATGVMTAATIIDGVGHVTVATAHGGDGCSL